MFSQPFGNASQSQAKESEILGTLQDLANSKFSRTNLLADFKFQQDSSDEEEAIAAQDDESTVSQTSQNSQNFNFTDIQSCSYIDKNTGETLIDQDLLLERENLANIVDCCILKFHNLKPKSLMSHLVDKVYDGLESLQENEVSEVAFIGIDGFLKNTGES